MALFMHGIGIASPLNWLVLLERCLGVAWVLLVGCCLLGVAWVLFGRCLSAAWDADCVMLGCCLGAAR
eukprot:7905205-Lingulodinium_polyedra.AAC.1